MRKKKSSELEHRALKSIPESLERRLEEKKEWGLSDQGTIFVKPHSCLQSSRRRGEKGGAGKMLEEVMAKIFQIDGNYKPRDTDWEEKRKIMLICILL